MEPSVHHFRGGWSAVGRGFATFAATREEALRQYWLHVGESSSCSAAGCHRPAAHVIDGVQLCDAHYAYVKEGGENIRRDLSPEAPRESDCEGH